MLLYGAIIPPRAPLDAVLDLVRSVPVPDRAPAEPAPAGFLRRRGKRERTVPALEERAALDLVPPDLVHFPITGFGNLTSGDATRLVETLAAAAAAWSAVPVRFAGGAALEFPGDWSVWATLDGDLEALRAIARGVTESVESLGFFVDRRVFRPMLSLATVTEATTGPYLEAVVGALDAFEGEQWVVDHVTVTTKSYAGDGAGFTEFRRIDLG